MVNTDCMLKPYGDCSIRERGLPGPIFGRDLSRLANRLPELFRHISADGKLDPAKALVLPFFTVLQEIVLITCGIGTEAHRGHSLYQSVHNPLSRLISIAIAL